MCLPGLLFPPQTVVTIALAFTTFGRSLSSSFSFLPFFSSVVSRFLGGCFDITGIALWSLTTWTGQVGVVFNAVSASRFFQPSFVLVWVS
ncbi:hypothetical protein BJX65DRAFT_195327 [Aspergillus insuetus]